MSSINVNSTETTEKENKLTEETIDKMVKKPGRTLLVSATNQSSKNKTILSKLTGLTTNHSTENGSFFLTFDTIQNSLDSFSYLRENHPEFRVKFARYQIFFTISGLENSSDYGLVKQDITNFVEKEAGAHILYFKLYRKGDKYIGCGDFTIDTKDAMDKLLKKDSSIKNFTIGELSGSFYRYNKTKQNQNNEDFEHN